MKTLCTLILLIWMVLECSSYPTADQLNIKSIKETPLPPLINFYILKSFDTGEINFYYPKNEQHRGVIIQNTSNINVVCVATNEKTDTLIVVVLAPYTATDPILIFTSDHKIHCSQSYTS